MANGEKVPSTGICQRVRFSVADNFFVADFYIIPLGGFDFVLGIKWLQTLGPILWDFVSLTMTFKLAGNSVTLQWQRQPDEPQLHLI